MLILIDHNHRFIVDLAIKNSDFPVRYPMAG